MYPAEAIELATGLLEMCRRSDHPVITAESCTAGLLAQVLSDAPGAAKLFHGGFVVYTKRQKTKALGVPDAMLQSKSAVCLEVATAMAQGAIAHSSASLAASITGVAGPDPDEDGNPVGKVCIAAVERDGRWEAAEFHFGELPRETIRELAVIEALRLMTQLAGESG